MSADDRPSPTPTASIPTAPAASTGSARVTQAPASAPPATACEHAWITESRHRTSQGVVVYVRCACCPARRVDLCGEDGMPPSAASRVVGGIPPVPRRLSSPARRQGSPAPRQGSPGPRR